MQCVLLSLLEMVDEGIQHWQEVCKYFFIFIYRVLLYMLCCKIFVEKM